MDVSFSFWIAGGYFFVGGVFCIYFQLRDLSYSFLIDESIKEPKKLIK